MRLLKSFAVLFGLLLSGAAAAADGDADGVPDDVDVCPADDATGHDLYVDGCVDTVADFPAFIEGLGLARGAETTLVAVAERAALSVSRDRPFIAMLQLHTIQNIASVLFDTHVLTLDQRQAINRFATDMTASI